MCYAGETTTRRSGQQTLVSERFLSMTGLGTCTGGWGSQHRCIATRHPTAVPKWIPFPAIWAAEAEAAKDDCRTFVLWVRDQMGNHYAWRSLRQVVAARFEMSTTNLSILPSGRP
jgi:hypothetical protein